MTFWSAIIHQEWRVLPLKNGGARFVRSCHLRNEALAVCRRSMCVTCVLLFIFQFYFLKQNRSFVLPEWNAGRSPKASRTLWRLMMMKMVPQDDGRLVRRNRLRTTLTAERKQLTKSAHGFRSVPFFLKKKGQGGGGCNTDLVDSRPAALRDSIRGRMRRSESTQNERKWSAWISH